jgi:hypothetical protein
MLLGTFFFSQMANFCPKKVTAVAVNIEGLLNTCIRSGLKSDFAKSF